MKKRTAAALALVTAGLPWKIDSTCYKIHSRKVKHPLRICVIADLHSTWFGVDQYKLIDKINKAAPDIIVFPGDLFDERKKPDAVYTLIRRLHDYPMFYVQGNHEKRAPLDQQMIWNSWLKAHGVQILEDECIYIPDANIEIAGMHCMHHEPDCRPKDVSMLFRHRGYRILLSHRHHFESFYRDVDCDLVISGHAHGGQWRIPFLHRGIYAPQSGLFPGHTEGIFPNGDHMMIVSRGLNRSAHGIMRLYNNPELVFVDLLCKE